MTTKLDLRSEAIQLYGDWPLAGLEALADECWRLGCRDCRCLPDLDVAQRWLEWYYGAKGDEQPEPPLVLNDYNDDRA